MPRFSYKAYNAEGVLKSGEVAAASRTLALDLLARRAEFPIEISDDGMTSSGAWWQQDVFSARQLPIRDLATFTREVSALVQANVVLDETLRIVALQPLVSQRVRQATAKCLERILEGQSLSDALKAQSPAFPEFYCRLVEAGESSGALGDVLEDLARFLERSAEIRARVGSALVYPAVLLVAAVAAVGVIATVLVPAIQPIFEDAQVAPPYIIQAMSDARTFLASYWLPVLAAAVALAAGLASLRRNEEFCRVRDRVLLATPLIGRLISYSETARFSRTLAAMLRNGVPVLEAIRSSGAVLGNSLFKSAADDAAAAIKEGGSLIEPFSRSGVFPDLFIRLGSIGEKSGQLDTMLNRVADLYDAALQRQLDRMMSLVTPVLTLMIGALVGTLILSVMNALVSINELAIQ